jgi:hypothetical protein
VSQLRRNEFFHSKEKPAHLAAALLGCWQWYGPKPLTTMISRKHDVSGETGAKKGHIKVSEKYGTFLHKL